MTGDTRIPQPPGTRDMLKASSVVSSAPLKRHSPISKLTKGTIARSPSSSSSSDSLSGKKCVDGGKAIAKVFQETPKDAATILSSKNAVVTAVKERIPQGKDTPAAATLSISEGTAETKTGTNYELLNELSFECVGPDETKRIIDMAEPSPQTPGSELKDVFPSKLAASSWFTLDDIQEFDDCFMDRNSHITISDVAVEATARRLYVHATPEGINKDDYGEAIGSTNKPLQLQENSHEDDKVVLVGVINLETEDVSEGKDVSIDGSTVLKKTEGIREVKLAFENLMGEAGQVIAAAWSGWRTLCVEVLFPASVLILCIVLLWENLIEDELDKLPPPT